LKAQVTASYRGFQMANSTFPYVAEYNNRQRLRAIGYTDSLENLDAITGEYFVEIAKVISELEKKEMEKQ
jgi:hypothetical protein